VAVLYLSAFCVYLVLLQAGYVSFTFILILTIPTLINQYRFIGEYTDIPLLTQPQQRYDKKYTLALGMRFLTVKIDNS